MKKRKIVAWFVGVALVLSAAGCSKNDTILVPKISAKQVIKVDGESYSLPQAKVYLANYKNLYGTVAGVNLWEQESQSQSLGDYVKDLTVSQMTKILSMDSLAKSRNIDLDETEKTNVQKAAKAYYDSLNELEISYLEVDETDIQKLYEDYSLAQKLYKSLTADINSEVSDDEARIMDAMQIVVSDKKTARTVSKALADGGDFVTLASSYNEAEEVTIQFGRGELPQEVEKAAFALKDGTVTDCIQIEDGYYFIYCVNKFNEELTDDNKLKIVQQREKAAFGDIYDAYSKTISKKVYHKVWDDVVVDASENIATDSFFATYEEYCKETY